MYNNGAPQRVTDNAAVPDDAENLKLAAWAADRRQRQPVPAIIVNIQRQPGANVIQTVDRIAALLPRLEASLPASITVTPLTDRTVSIRASIADVEFELLLAVVLVVLVIFFFLRSPSATLIPSVAVPLSLVGTFRSEEHTSELQSLTNLVCRLLLEKKKKETKIKSRIQISGRPGYERHSGSTSRKQ